MYLYLHFLTNSSEAGPQQSISGIWTLKFLSLNSSSCRIDRTFSKESVQALYLRQLEESTSETILLGRCPWLPSPSLRRLNQGCRYFLMDLLPSLHDIDWWQLYPQGRLAVFHWFDWNTSVPNYCKVH